MGSDDQRFNLILFVLSLGRWICQIKKDPNQSLSLSVRQRRFELPHPFGRYHLKVVRLPISPSPQKKCANVQMCQCANLPHLVVDANVKFSGGIKKYKSGNVQICKCADMQIANSATSN